MISSLISTWTSRFEIPLLLKQLDGFQRHFDLTNAMPNRRRLHVRLIRSVLVVFMVTRHLVSGPYPAAASPLSLTFRNSRSRWTLAATMVLPIPVTSSA